MKENYCTLFDTAYLSRGLAMYYSILERTTDFHLFIYAFDESCYKLLKEIDLSHATIISLDEFEDEDLLVVKKDRTYVEYCWTCTPSIILYSLREYNLKSCTYVDADLYFFENPKILLQEMKEDSVSISEHRYSDPSKQEALRGKYCVQFMTFYADQNGYKVLKWWRKRCLEWCFAYYEDGKFGDQLYLDDWLERFEGIHVLQHEGCGIAPWNMDQYKYRSEGSKVVAKNKKTHSTFTVIFYHFHSFRIFLDESVKLSYYPMSKDIIFFLYIKYIKAIIDAELIILKSSKDISLNDLREETPNLGIMDKLRSLKHQMIGINNKYKINQLIKGYARVN